MFRIYPTRHKHFGVVLTWIVEADPETGAETGDTYYEWGHIVARKDVDHTRSIILVAGDDTGMIMPLSQIHCLN